MNLKGVIFGVEDVLLSQSGSGSFPEICNLLGFLKSKNLQPVVLANRDLKIAGQALDTFFDSRGFHFPWFIHDRSGSGVPKKPAKDAVTHVLNKMGWTEREVLYIGNDDADMMTAANGGLLFLSAQWYAQQPYGMRFASPREIGRFIDIFCLRDHLWHYEVHGVEAEFYALGTYGFLEDKYKTISSDAKEAAKYGRGHPDFWIQYLLSTVYFSGISFNYIATFPSSQKGINPVITPETVKAFASCFKKSYLPDLIYRHTNCTKSTVARNSGSEVDHYNQLNTINLEKLPFRKEGVRYVASPLGHGKTVLIIDDFCTRGFAQEAARLFIKQTGAKAIGLSLLKTINRGYKEITASKPNKFNPFQPCRFEKVDFVEHSYHDSIKDSTHAEIENNLRRYDNWNWPS